MSCKPKERVFEYTSHPFPVRIFFVPDAESWTGLFAELGIDEPYPRSDAHMASVASSEPGQANYVLVTVNERMDERPWDHIVCAMAHECVHVLQEVEDFVGGDLGAEGQAYFVQDLLFWLTRVYAKAGRTWKDDNTCDD